MHVQQMAVSHTHAQNSNTWSFEVIVFDVVNSRATGVFIYRCIFFPNFSVLFSDRWMRMFAVLFFSFFFIQLSYFVSFLFALVLEQILIIVCSVFLSCKFNTIHMKLHFVSDEMLHVPLFFKILWIINIYIFVSSIQNKNVRFQICDCRLWATQTRCIYHIVSTITSNVKKRCDLWLSIPCNDKENLRMKFLVQD